MQPTPSPTSNPPDTARRILEAVRAATPPILGLVVVDHRGQVQASSGGERQGLEALTAFAVGAYELLTRMAEEAGFGASEFTVLRAEAGHIAIHSVRSDLVLFALADEDAPLGTLSYDLAWCVTQLRERVPEFRDDAPF